MALCIFLNESLCDDSMQHLSQEIMIPKSWTFPPSLNPSVYPLVCLSLIPACLPDSFFSLLSPLSHFLSQSLTLSHSFSRSKYLPHSLALYLSLCLSFAHEPASWPRMSSWLLPDQRWTGCCKKVTDVRVIAISLFVGLSSPLMSFPTKKIFINSNKRPRFFTATEFSLFTFSNATAIRESCIYELASQTTHPAASSIEKFYRCFMTGRIFDGVIATEMSQTMSRLEMTGSSAY